MSLEEEIRKDIYVSFTKAAMVGSISISQLLPDDQVLRYHDLGVMILVYDCGWWFTLLETSAVGFVFHPDNQR